MSGYPNDPNGTDPPGSYIYSAAEQQKTKVLEDTCGRFQCCKTFGADMQKMLIRVTNGMDKFPGFVVEMPGAAAADMNAIGR